MLNNGEWSRRDGDGFYGDGTRIQFKVIFLVICSDKMCFGFCFGFLVERVWFVHQPTIMNGLLNVVAIIFVRLRHRIYARVCFS